MLKHWQTHAEYQQFISDAVSHLNESQRKKLNSYSDSIAKLTALNLDPVRDFMLPFYSHTGRPAQNQPQLLRSFVLLMDLHCLSVDSWVNTLAQDDLLAILIGCSPDSLPPLGSYYDFIDRLWLMDPALEKLGRKDTFPCNKNKKPSANPGKNKKLPNKHSGVTKTIADFIRSGRDFPFHYEKTLQELFHVAAIVPSLELGLIPSENLTVSGDGTCVHTHASPFGHKICDCAKHGVSDCRCPRHFSDPDASIGWDSGLGSYYFGYTLYMIACHNEEFHIDLPLHIRFLDAKRHDNYPTYELCSEWDVIPFIDLNSNRGRPEAIPKRLNIDKDGTPLCNAGFRMTYWGYSPARHDMKWRCPVATGKEERCTCEFPCSSSPYGRCLYTKPDWDIRLYPPVARGTEEYKKTYNNRTGSERVNDRILNNYHLHDMRIHVKKRYSFFTMIAGINIHLDARLKVQKLKSA